MKISFADLPSSLPKSETWVFPVGDDKKFGALLQAADKKAGKLISKTLEASRFAGKKGQYLSVTTAGLLGASRVILAGVGKAKDMDALVLQGAGGGLVPQLNALGVKEAVFVAEGLKDAAQIGYGAKLRSYRFDKYKTNTLKEEDKPTFAQLTVLTRNSKAEANAYARLEKVANGIFFTRDLVSEPANIINPETLAEECKKLSTFGVEVEILGEDEMYKLGMNSLLGVGQGSARESQLVVMRYNGADKKVKPVAFVGKGVTFDTGGISIKPSNGMEEMKWDMGGAGTVIGLMQTLASRKAKVNAVGVVGLVENMPGGNAQRPGDVVKSMSGQTIEVINTDAEGRLVLADALWYTQVNFKPKLIVDLATLTGAIIVALGSHRAGLFSNDDTLAKQLYDCGEATGEVLWRQPMGDYYDKLINSDIADMVNSTNVREAGSITAAQFLKRFIKDGTPWAHLDIAGTAWTTKDKDTCPKGATAFGIRLLDRFVSEHHEGK